MTAELGKQPWLKRLRNTFDPDWFKAICLFVSILNCIPILTNTITPFLKLFHVYALIVVLFDLFGERRILRNKGRCLLFLWAICYAVTLLRNSELITFSGLSDFGYVLIALAVVYSYGSGSVRHQRITANILCAIISGLNLVGIWMFFTKFFIYCESTGNFIGMYVHENRLCGMWGNPAVQGMMAFIGLCLSGILFFSCRGRKRILYVFFASISFVVMLLANARTTIYCFTCVCMVFAFLQTIKNRKKQVIRAAGIALLVMVMALAGCRLVQHVISFIDVKYDYYLDNIDEDVAIMRLEAEQEMQQEGQEEPGQTEADSIGNENEQETAVHHSQMTIERTSNDLNGRWVLWQAGVQLVLNKPIFGYGLNNLDNGLEELGYNPMSVNGNLHNVYLDVLVAFGITGFGCMVLFLLIMLGNVKKFFKYCLDENWAFGAMLTAATAGFLLYAVVDSSPMFSMYPTAIAFWYILSSLADLTEHENKENGHYRPELVAILEEKWSWKREKEKKSICFVNDSLGGGGAEQVLVNVSNALVDQEYDVTVMTLWSGEILESRLDDRVRLVTADPFDCRLLKRVLFWINRHHMPKKLYNFLFLNRRYDYTVAFLEGISTILVADTKVQTGDIKYAWVHVDFKSQNWVLPFYSSKEAQMESYRPFDRIFCVSDAVRQSFVEVIGFPEKAVTQINLLDTRRVIQLGQEPCPVMRPEGLLLCAVGRLNPQKGFDRLISVVGQLLQDGIDCTLWIMGEGACRTALEAQIKDLGLGEKVRLMGFCANPYCYCAQADVFVLSSRFEGYSTVIIENLVLGKAIVSTLCAGVSEQLGDSEFGLVVENTEEALLDGMKQMLTDEKLRQYYTEKALERSKSISYDVILEQFVKIFSVKED